MIKPGTRVRIIATGAVATVDEVLNESTLIVSVMTTRAVTVLRLRPEDVAEIVEALPMHATGEWRDEQWCMK